MVTDEEYEAAANAGEELHRSAPHAVRARYDRRLRRIVVRLSSGMDLAFAPRDVQGLEAATPEQLSEVVIEGVGHGLHWPNLDADVYIPSLLKGDTGTKSWMARRGKTWKRREDV